MPERRLLLDGPDLQALARRAEELGGRVVRAERLRKGLLGKQWYEVTVAVPAPVGPVVPAPAGPELPAPAASAPARPTPPSPAGPAAPSPSARRPAGIRDLLAAAEAAERTEAAAGRAARAAHEAAAKKARGR